MVEKSEEVLTEKSGSFGSGIVTTIELSIALFLMAIAFWFDPPADEDG
jgi:hypothetical protein